MQRTRLNTLVNQTTLRFRQWVFNPWRRLAVVLISLLFGNFFATAIAATAGQAAKLDVTISAVLVLVVEFISWLYYRLSPRRLPGGFFPGGRSVSPDGEINRLGPGSQPIDTDLGPVRSRSTVAEALNAFKLGMIYGLFVEAFKLGS